MKIFKAEFPAIIIWYYRICQLYTDTVMATSTTIPFTTTSAKAQVPLECNLLHAWL